MESGLYFNNLNFGMDGVKQIVDWQASCTRLVSVAKRESFPWPSGADVPFPTSCRVVPEASSDSCLVHDNLDAGAQERSRKAAL